MSSVCSKENYSIISHLQYLHDLYKETKSDSNISKLTFSNDFFKINSQFLRQNQINKNTDKRQDVKKKKQKETTCNNLDQVTWIQEECSKAISEGKENKMFEETTTDFNEEARLASRNFYSLSSHLNIEKICGRNDFDTAVIREVNNEKYVFPKHCEFFSFDVRQIEEKLPMNNRYDLILLDPPWWNKSIRRKKTAFAESSYQMMPNEEILEIPIARLINKEGLVVVWCTNASSHLRFILEKMFPSWGLNYHVKWFWVKVTTGGQTICDFSFSSGKQPFELLIIGSSVDIASKIPNNKLIISVPSAIHSHKPPIIELVKSYLPNEPKCLELFARYLLPGWTSWGLEVLKLQHLSLFNVNEEV